VEPALILQSLRGGADGVLVCGCHPGDCHYVSGNHRAALRFAALSRMLAQVGLEPDRVRLEWVSASESQRFVAVAEEMTERIRALGPLRWPHLAVPGADAPEEGHAP
jgi:coenzyme F420-reducing hydrogenase delta subunit